MGNDKIGVPLQELLKIEQDWHSISERMGQMAQQLGHIHSTIAKAAAVDLAASSFAGLPGFGVAFEVLRDVQDIEGKAKHLLADKNRLTKEIAEDAGKIKAVKAEYEAIEKAIEDELKKIRQPDPVDGRPVHQPPRQPVGDPGGSGHHPNPGHPEPGHPKLDGGAGNGEGHDSGDPGTTPPQGHGTGDWKTTGDWDAWSPGRHHTREGAGVQTGPKLEGLDKERQDVLQRALDRINHRIGYSQSAFTNGYRDDCSGFVSAAWGLQGPGLNTWGLMEHNISHQISKDELKPGDALIAGDHTVLFGGWADAAHTRYIAMEDNGSQGTVSHVIPYPYWPSSDSGPYHPYRRNGMN